MKTIENYKFRDMILRIGKKAEEAQVRSLANDVPKVFSSTINKGGNVFKKLSNVLRGELFLPQMLVRY